VLGLLSAVAVGGAVYYWFSCRKPKPRIQNPWRSTFRTSTETLRNLVKHIHTEMEQGLKKENGSSLKMLTSFVAKPTGQEKGTFLALDLGGTNFRVLQLELKGDRLFGNSLKQQFTISDTAMNGEAEQLFDFIADCVGEFLQNNHTTQSNKSLSLGFTFSFPVNQTGVAQGTLIEWTKGFSTKGVVGKDVVELLNESLKRKEIKVKVVALANDTVGTMIAQCYKDPKCEMGVILGTGTNACYSEKVSNIVKFTGKTYSQEEMIINMEWGGLSGNALPLNEIDNKMDEKSIRSGHYRFEKMISGYYLGELTRLVLLDLSAKKLIFMNGIPKLLKQPYEFTTAHMSEIQKDKSSDLKGVAEFLRSTLYVKDTTLQERQMIYDVCDMVSERAARLSAAAIVAVVSKIRKLNDCTVAVDGGVFEHYPGFRDIIEATILELEPTSHISLVLSKDGSGIGAAAIACSVDS